MQKSERSHACVHVLRIGDYLPDMCAITLPRIRDFATRIGADYHEITTREHPKLPLFFEIMQIWEKGAKYDWNVLVDADILLHQNMLNPIEQMSAQPSAVGVAVVLRELPSLFDPLPEHMPYFLRAPHGYSMAPIFVVTNRITHDLWHPIPFAEKFENADVVLKTCRGRRNLNEYALALNVARFGLQLAPALKLEHIYHINSTSSAPEDSAKVARDVIAAWNEGRQYGPVGGNLVDV